MFPGIRNEMAIAQIQFECAWLLNRRSMKTFPTMPREFENHVYDAVRHIPKGCVTTYGILAHAVGCRSCRAVGQALRRNPYAPEVPCHRVIASDLRIGGFAGSRTGPSIERKRRMLAAEGVTFRKGRLADPDRVFRFRT